MTILPALLPWLKVFNVKRRNYLKDIE